MGSLSFIDSKSHSLVASSPSNSRVAHKKESKGKQTNSSKSNNSSHSSPKPDSKRKKNPLKCAFCGKDGHSKSHCFKKLTVLSSEMKKHNLNINLSSPRNDTGNVKSLSSREYSVFL